MEARGKEEMEKIRGQEETEEVMAKEEQEEKEEPERRVEQEEMKGGMEMNMETEEEEKETSGLVRGIAEDHGGVGANGGWVGRKRRKRRRSGGGTRKGKEGHNGREDRGPESSSP